MIVTNHTYDVIGSYVPTKEMGANSSIVYDHLSQQKKKRMERLLSETLSSQTAKSRLSKENKEVTVRLYYDERGLDKYYGLLELGEIGGMWKNVAGRYEMDGKKVYAKEILKNPEKYFTQEVLEQLDEISKDQFSYGSSI